MMNSRLSLHVALVVTVAACDRKADKPPAPKTAAVASPVVIASTSSQGGDEAGHA